MDEWDDKQKAKYFDQLMRAIDRVYHSPHHLVWRGFVTGLASGLGATIGVAIVFALLGFLLKELGGIPVIGEWLGGISNKINQF